MQNGTTWILVANASQGRLFRFEKGGKRWLLVSEHEHPESRAKSGELLSDSNPASTHGGGSAARRAKELHTDPKEVEIRKFAHELAGMIEKGFDDNAFTRLVLVAPPHFLGLLRMELPEKVTRRVGATLHKDFHELSARDLQERVLLEEAA